MPRRAGRAPAGTTSGEPEDGDEENWSSPASVAAAEGRRVWLPPGARPGPRRSGKPELPEAMAMGTSLLRRHQQIPQAKLHKFDGDHACPAGFVSAQAAPAIADASKQSKGARKRTRVALQIREGRQAGQAEYDKPLPSATRELRAAERLMSIDSFRTEAGAGSITFCLNRAEHWLDLAQADLAVEAAPKEQDQEFEPALLVAGSGIFRRSLQIGSKRRQSPDASI